jgi:flagellar basal-body rod protein FlgC
MDLLNPTFAIAASALRAERMRLDVIASNLANANTTRTEAGGPYRRRHVVFETEPIGGFAETIAALGTADTRRGVEVTAVVDDPTPPRLVFDPGHPDANAEGYVAYPNVNPVLEMVDLMAATRAYEANVQVVNATKRMAESALSISS